VHLAGFHYKKKILSFTTAVLDNILIYFKVNYFIGLSENDDNLTLRSQANKKNTLFNLDWVWGGVVVKALRY
jgi:hypothetical protein